MTTDGSKQIVEASHVLEACRNAGVLLYYHPDFNIFGVSGDAAKIACLVMDVLKLEEPIKRLMSEMEILDSLGTPKHDQKNAK